MERSTALSAAGAMTLTAAAAVSALFLTVDRGSAGASEPTTPAVVESEVVTEYEVVTVDAAAADTGSAMADHAEDTEHESGEHGDEYPEDDEMEDEHPEGDEYPEDDEMDDDEMEDEDDDEDDDD